MSATHPRTTGLLSLFLLLLSLHPLQVEAQGNEGTFLQQFLAGHYTLIGREEDSGAPFTGSVTLAATKDGLTLTRTIKNRQTTGSGNIETATADTISVLRLRFSDNGIAYEATCLIGSDLNNYARLTCQRYRADGTTIEPALEALFIAPR